jgi:molybdate transport system regulatory protein
MVARESPIELQGAVWMTVGGENFGGSSRIVLLAAIAQCGSITQAAKLVGMSYKAAWEAIDTMNNLAGEPLVERVSGGKGGGGTRLTQRGKQLVENFGLIEQAHREFVAQLSRQADGIADDFLLIKKMTLKTSARNQFAGNVTQVRRGAVNDEIELEVAGGQKIIAVITHESTDALELRAGSQAFALIKASSVILVAGGEGGKFSARNCLPGVVSRVVPGAVNTEVMLALDGGGVIAAMMTNDSSDSLGLAVGVQARAIFKASSVIVGITD